MATTVAPDTSLVYDPVQRLLKTMCKIVGLILPWGLLAGITGREWPQPQIDWGDVIIFLPGVLIFLSPVAYYVIRIIVGGLQIIVHKIFADFKVLVERLQIIVRKVITDFKESYEIWQDRQEQEKRRARIRHELVTWARSTPIELEREGEGVRVIVEDRDWSDIGITFRSPS